MQKEDLLYFRGDNAYVWQLRGLNMNVLGYALAAYYVKSIDRLGLFDSLAEDEHFGNVTFIINGKAVSRDLLDSILELDFLDRHLNIGSVENVNILDVGAGYGRLAYRTLSAFPNIQSYFCTDAVAISTFICGYYLRFRGLNNNAHVIPLDQLETVLSEQTIEVALNIHSFSECNLAAINWWVGLLAKYRVRYFVIVPNTHSYESAPLLAAGGEDFMGILQCHGYKLEVMEPKYRDPLVQAYGMNPAYYYLFELAGAS